MSSIELEIPRAEDLTVKSIVELGSKLKKVIHEWDRRESKGIEYVSFGGISQTATEKEYKECLEHLLARKPDQYERIIPLLALSKGSNEGYRVTFYLQRNAPSIPVKSSDLIEILNVKVWDRSTQYDLYCYLDELLSW